MHMDLYVVYSTATNVYFRYYNGYYNADSVLNILIPFMSLFNFYQYKRCCWFENTEKRCIHVVFISLPVDGATQTVLIACSLGM